MTDALLVGGTSLAALGRIVQDFGPGLGGAPAIRNDADVVPRRIGSIQVDSVTGSMIVPVKMLLLGKTSGGQHTRPQYHDTAAALRALVFNRGRAFVLTRTRDQVAGTVTHNAGARYLRGLESIEQVAAHGGRVAFDLEVFGGYFYDVSSTLVHAGTVSIAGDVDTRRIELTLPGAGTLTNVTLGIALTVTVGCNITVESFTADAGIASLSWSGDDYWFALAPGSNVITWSGGGTPDIHYVAAWL